MGAGMDVAWQASWRFALLVTAVLFVPFALVAFILDSLAGAGGPLWLVPWVFGVSIVIHEAGHVVSHQFLCPSASTARSLGSWTSASVERQALLFRDDIIVSITGPLAGASCAGFVFLIHTTIPLVTWCAGGLIVAYHLFSLLPFSQDGKQVLLALKERTYA